MLYTIIYTRSALINYSYQVNFTHCIFFFLSALPDPSLSDGYSIIFEGEIPIKVKNYNANGTNKTIQPTVQPNLIPEMITVRILTNHVISVRMELSNEVHLHVQLITVSSINYILT